jgi:hypothetical protein
VRKRSAPFLRERLTNVRLAIVLETATTLGAASGVLLSGVVPVPVLYAIFAIILLVSAWQMRRRRAVVTADGNPTQGWARRLDAVYPDRTLGRDVPYRVDRLPARLSSRSSLHQHCLELAPFDIPILFRGCQNSAPYGAAVQRLVDYASLIHPSRSVCDRKMRHLVGVLPTRVASSHAGLVPVNGRYP